MAGDGDSIYLKQEAALTAAAGRHPGYERFALRHHGCSKSLSNLLIGRNSHLWQSPVNPGLDSTECNSLLRGWFCLWGCSVPALQPCRWKEPFSGKLVQKKKNNHFLLSSFCCCLRGCDLHGQGETVPLASAARSLMTMNYVPAWRGDGGGEAGLCRCGCRRPLAALCWGCRSDSLPFFPSVPFPPEKLGPGCRSRPLPAATCLNPPGVPCPREESGPCPLKDTEQGGAGSRRAFVP